MGMYREVRVWERKSTGELICYRCLEVLPHGGFCVQSADLFRPGDDMVERARICSSQFVELLGEEAPEARAMVKPTLQEAIEEHKQAFLGL